MLLEHPIVVFSPDHLGDHPIPLNSFVVAVRYARRGEAYADVAAKLRDLGHDVVTAWVEAGVLEATPVLLAAERRLAEAIALSLTAGRARRITVYNEHVELLPVASQAEVETVCEV
jgi:hypothetical protein